MLLQVLVAMINVTCKSAPAPDRFRLSEVQSKGGLLDISQLDKAFRDKGKAVRRRQSGLISSAVPSGTGVEVDDWGEVRSEDGNTPFQKKPELEYDDDDDDEGNMTCEDVVNPKRQQSIQSLRHHLQRHTSLSQATKAKIARARRNTGT